MQKWMLLSLKKKMVNNINYNDCVNSRYWKIITAIMCVCTKTEIYVPTKTCTYLTGE